MENVCTNLASHKSKGAEVFSFQCLHLNHIKNKMSITGGDYSIPSQVDILNLIVNSSDANKDRKAFVIGGY